MSNLALLLQRLTHSKRTHAVLGAAKRSNGHSVLENTLLIATTKHRNRQTVRALHLCVLDHHTSAPDSEFHPSPAAQFAQSAFFSFLLLPRCASVGVTREKHQVSRGECCFRVSLTSNPFFFLLFEVVFSHANQTTLREKMADNMIPTIPATQADTSLERTDTDLNIPIKIEASEMPPSNVEMQLAPLAPLAPQAPLIDKVLLQTQNKLTPKQVEPKNELVAVSKIEALPDAGASDERKMVPIEALPDAGASNERKMAPVSIDQIAMRLVHDPHPFLLPNRPMGSGKFGFVTIDKSYTFVQLDNGVTRHDINPASAKDNFLGTLTVDLSSAITTDHQDFGKLYFVVGSRLQAAESTRLGVHQDCFVMSVATCSKGVVLGLGHGDSIERVITVSTVFVEELIFPREAPHIGDVNRWKQLMLQHLQKRLNARGVAINARAQPDVQVAGPTASSSNMAPLTDREDRVVLLRLQVADNKVTKLEQEASASAAQAIKMAEKLATAKANQKAAETDRGKQIKDLQEQMAALRRTAASPMATVLPQPAVSLAAVVASPPPIAGRAVRHAAPPPAARKLPTRRRSRSPSPDEQLDSSSTPARRPPAKMKDERKRPRMRSRSRSPSRSHSRCRSTMKRGRSASPSDDSEPKRRSSAHKSDRRKH